MRRNGIHRRAGIVLVAALAVLAACTSHDAVAPSTASTSSAPSSTPSSTPASTTRSTTPQPSATTRRNTAAPPTTRRTTPRPVPAPVLKDPLNGGTLSKNPVLAVKIENTYFGTPQFGLADADLVFVEQVEGGLTRLIGIFHSNLDVEVGPIRSVRSTDAQLLPMFAKKLALVFSGGQGGTMDLLIKSGVVDTSSFGSGYFRSDVAYGTYNLHAQLNTIAAQVPGLTPARPIGLTFQASDARVGKGRAATSLQIIMQAGETDFAFRGGHYVRLRNGEELSDYQGKLEVADNVLVQHVVDEPDGFYDSIGSPSYVTHTVGSGKVTLYRDGHAIDGTWKRAGVSQPFVFADNSGRPLPFKPGHTWIALAPQSAQIDVS